MRAGIGITVRINKVVSKVMVRSIVMIEFIMFSIITCHIRVGHIEFPAIANCHLDRSQV